MTTKKITAVYMENGLKRNWTVEDFCNDLGIDEKEFKRILKKHFSQKVERYYLGKLSTNQKLFKKTSRHNSTNQVISDDSKATEEESLLSEATEEQIDEDIDALELSKRKEEELKQSIYDAEIEIKDLREERRKQQIKLEKIYKAFESLLEKIETERKNLGEVEIDLNRINNRIAEVCSEKSLFKKELSQVQDRIKELELITILFTASGEIKVLGYEGEIPDVEIDETLQQMMEIDLLEDLTIKELRILAKIIATAVYLENSTDRKVKFDFEEKDSNISLAVELLKLQEQEMANE